MEREIRIHVTLKHENIIELFAAFEDEQHVYLAQEWAAGEKQWNYVVRISLCD